MSEEYTEQEQREVRQLPANDLDLNLLLTDSVWGRKEVSKELRDRLERYSYVRDEGGKPVVNSEGQRLVSKSSLWGLLGYYTRDMRLSNLSTFDNTYYYVTYYLDLANDYLLCNMIEPFMICLSRAATQLECSQSKGGFLRKMQNTLRREDYHTELNPPKKDFFGGNQKGGN